MFYEGGNALNMFVNQSLSLLFLPSPEVVPGVSNSQSLPDFHAYLCTCFPSLNELPCIYIHVSFPSG